jgi:CRP-like cAMP-binding protein
MVENGHGREMDVLGYIDTLDEGPRRRLKPWAGRIPAALLSRCSLVRLKRGEQLVREHDRSESIYVLTRGTVASTSGFLDGGTYVIDEFAAPTVFGEMEAIGASPFYHSSLTAATDAELIRASNADYLEWLSGDPDALLARSRWVIQRISGQSSHERSLLGWEGRRRVAFELCRLYGASRAADDRFVVPFTRRELAERVGVSAKTVSRSLDSLEAEGMVRLEGRKIVIDREAYALLERMLSDGLDGSSQQGERNAR